MPELNLDPQVTIILIAAVATFGLVISIWVIVVGAWLVRRAAEEKKRSARLGLSQPHITDARVLRLWRDGKESTTLVPGHERRGGAGELMRRWFQSAGIASSPLSILLNVLLISGACALGAQLMTQTLVAAVAVFVAVWLVFYLVMTRRVTLRMALFDQQLIDALDLAARSLRAGHPLSGAFQLIAEEIPAPVGTVFADICQQEEMGVAHEKAIRQVASEADSPDMRLFATSIAIQLQSGGNLADTMHRLAEVIRDRMRLTRRVRVLTAQSKLSKNILLALPFLLFVVLSVMNPGYTDALYLTGVGRICLAVAAGGLMLGALTMSRMADLKY